MFKSLKFVSLYLLVVFGFTMCLVSADNNVDFTITPSSRDAISGTLVNFRFGMRNKTSLHCTGTLTYTLPSSFVITNNLRNLSPSPSSWVYRMSAGENRSTYQSITGYMNIFSWPDNTRYITVNGSYVCDGGIRGSETVRAEIQPVPDIVVVQTLQSLSPGKDGDLVQYKINLFNRGSAVASNYKFFDTFPHNYLDNFYITFGGYGYRAETLDGVSQRYFWLGSYLNLNPQTSLDIIVSGRLKSDRPDDGPFENISWIQDLVSEFNINNNNSIVETQVEYRDMLLNTNPEIQTSISGEQVVFDIGIQNPSNFDCNVDLRYILPNGLSLESSSRPLNPGIRDANISFDPMENMDDYLQIVANVVTQSWNISGLYLTVEMKHDCGFELQTISKRMYVNPIPELEVTKELISGNPSYTGELVQYKVRIRNVGSAPALNYRFYDNFPLDFLEDVSVRIGNINYNFNILGNIYYIDSSSIGALNIGGGSYVDVYVSGKLKSTSNKSTFVNTAWIESTNQYRNLNNTGFVDARVEVKDMSMNITPASQYAISGTNVSFDMSMTNNGDVVCNGELWYDLPNTKMIYVGGDNSAFVEGSRVEFELDPGETVSYDNIVGKVIINYRNDNSFYVDLNGRYKCGGAWISIPTQRAEIEPIADLIVNKEQTSVNPSNTGDIVEYVVTLNNVGSARAENYRLYDMFPSSYLELISVTFNGVVQNPVRLLNNEYYREGDFLTVNPGEMSQVVIRGRLKSNQNTNLFNNVARIDLLSPEYDTTNNSDTISTQVQIRDVQFIVNPNTQYAISGSNVGFTIGIKNNSSVQCTGELKYILPNGVIWKSSFGSLGNGFLNNVSATDISLPIGFNDVAYATITGEVRLQSWIEKSLYITVEGKYNCGAGIQTVVNMVEIEPIADLVVNKKINTGNPGNAGELVEYLVTIENVGSAIAKNYRFFDALPIELSYESASFGSHGIYNPRLFSNSSWYFWSGDYLTINPGDKLDIIIKTRVKPDLNQCLGELIINNAWIDLQTQYNTTNDYYSVNSIIESPDMSISVDVLGDRPEYLGDPVVFRINYSNNGNLVASGLVIRGLIDNKIENIISNQWQSSIVEVDDKLNINWPLGDAGIVVNPGDSFSFLITGYLNSDSYLSGTSICIDVEILDSLYSENMCNLYQDNVFSACQSTIGSIVDLSISKTLINNIMNIQSGDLLTYRIDFVNNGDYDATNIEVVDFIPMHIRYQSAQVFGSNTTSSCQIVDGVLVCSNIGLGSNQQGYIIMTGLLTQLGQEGLTLTNIAEIKYAGREINLLNNLVELVTSIPPLGDMVVTKNVVGIMPAVSNDLITYNISIHNNGGRVIENIRIEDYFVGNNNLREYVSSNYAPLNWNVDQVFGFWGYPYQNIELNPGESFNLTITGRLLDNCSAGELLPNMVLATTTSVQTTENNDQAYATGHVRVLTGIQADINVRNLTRNSVADNQNHIQAYSGDLIQITVNYINIGNQNGLFVYKLNTPGVNGLNGVGSINVVCGQDGEFVFTGVVGPNGYVRHPISLEYGYGLGYSASINGEITEIVLCGDGVISGPEVCDINGPIGVIYPGQECRIRNGDIRLGCELVTTNIINEGCVSFNYNFNGVVLSNEYCVDMGDEIGVIGPSCQTANIISRQNVGNTGINLQIECLGINTNSNTSIMLMCNDGIGTQYNGLGSRLVGTCSYSGNPGQTISVAPRCVVGNDNSTLQCLVSQTHTFASDPDSSDISCDLEINRSPVILQLNGNTYGGTANVRCETQDGQSVQSGRIKIDCNGDGVVDIQNTVSANFVEGICRYNYTKNEVESNTRRPKVLDVGCEIVDQEGDVCEETIMVDVPFLGYCGDGILEGSYEECDMGRNGGIILNYLDTNNTVTAPTNIRNLGYRCDSSCDLISPDNGGYVYEPPACFNTNISMSVQKGEIAPFYRNIDRTSEKYVETRNNCTSNTLDYIVKSDMNCHFKVINGKGNEVYNFQKKCFDNNGWGGVNSSLENKILNYFDTFMGSISLGRQSGKYYIEDFGLRGSENLSRSIDVYGEYKLILDKVYYSLCDNSVTTQPYNRMCEVNFTVTKPYLIQRSAFGATKVVAGDENIDLRDFYAIEPGYTNYNIIEKTDIGSIVEVRPTAYVQNTEISNKIKDFIDKYTKLSIKLDNNIVKDYTDSDITAIYKVPGKHIYIFEGNGGKLVLENKTNFYPREAFTIIVKGMDLIVNGSVKTNGMFLVMDGKISFEEIKENDVYCKVVQEVHGIFVTGKGFDASSLENISGLDRWCEYGSLKVNGVLIGNNIQKLVENRRANLNGWFNVVSDEKKSKLQRRTTIFDGASVLIDYNPSLWQDLPPGADEFTKVLEVYKE